MFRLLLILGSVIAVVFVGITAFNKIIRPDVHSKIEKSRSEQPGQPETVLPPLPEVSTGNVVAKPVVEDSGASPLPVEATGFYVFENRAVPESPFGRQSSTLGAGRDVRGFQISTDEVANAWIMRGPPLEVDQFKLLAKSLDVPQDELDLDFLLISVSEDWLRQWGLSVHFKDGAGWATLFDIEEEGSSLRFASHSVAIDATAGTSTAAVRLVSSPVVRCVTGEPWSFSADTQVPIAVLQRSEGVVSTAYEYKDVGLGLDGRIRKMAGGIYRAEITQRNGTVEATTGRDAAVPPQLREQVLKTTLLMEVGQWSCVGGVRSWRTEKKKRLLGSEEREEQDLLLVFVRPRQFLQAVPKAWPVGDRPGRLEDLGPDAWEMDSDAHPLLPPKPGRSLEDIEAEFLREHSERRSRKTLRPRHK